MAKAAPVKLAFEQESRRIAIGDIQPLRLVTDAHKKTKKYAQIVATFREVGFVELPVVALDRSAPGKPFSSSASRAKPAFP